MIRMSSVNWRRTSTRPPGSRSDSSSTSIAYGERKTRGTGTRQWCGDSPTPFGNSGLVSIVPSCTTIGDPWICGPVGKLHAKTVVADEERVFVTSANLTFAAWEDNVELGLLVRDRALAKGIVSHFQTLIDLDYLRQLPE